jgi:hypothetical protein
MAKRSNPKKEKAERNKAYARQFRKKLTQKSYRGKGFGRNNFSRDDDNSTQDKQGE